jgi:dihydroorotate dehydrogenase electron transfer subunit
MIIQHTSVELAEKLILSGGLVKEKFRSGEIASRLKPGNFVHIRVSMYCDPLFRRAMSIHECDGDTFTIFFRVVGKGTKILSQVREGETVDILGPLGNGFEQPLPGEKIIMVSGGTGLPPLHFFTRRLIDNNAFADDNILFLCGISSSVDSPLVNDAESLGVPCRISSDDGCIGYRGFVTDLLVDELDKADIANTRVYSCGPDNMLRAVSELCRKRGVRCQVSLEGHMPCGIGTCLGCVVQSSESDTEFRRICKEGPVFDSDEVVI